MGPEAGRVVAVSRIPGPSLVGIIAAGISPSDAAFSRPGRAHLRNLTWSKGRLRKDKRQTCRKLGSGGLNALVETHNSLHHLQ
jgi:hypothetical protein